MKKTITKIDDCYIGSSIERSEDDTLIAGKGIYGDDVLIVIQKANTEPPDKIDTREP